MLSNCKNLLNLFFILTTVKRITTLNDWVQCVFVTPMFQYPLGLFDCNENKTQELIAFLKKLSNDYTAYKNDNIVEPVFWGVFLSFV